MKIFMGYKLVSPMKPVIINYKHTTFDNVLDTGCGVGNLVWGFVNIGIPVEGIGVSKDTINRSSTEARSLLKVGDITILDYSDNRFDLVNCSETLEHIPERVFLDIIRSLHRVKSMVNFKHLSLAREERKIRFNTY